MIAGIDVGITTTKIAFLDGGAPRGFCLVPAAGDDAVASASGALGSLLRAQGLPLPAIRRLALTGIRAAAIGEELLGLPCARVSEFQATGRGGLFLSGLARAIVVSMGTGTSVVRAGADGVRHLGGSGVGGGTLLGLAKALLHTTDVPTIIEAAAAGNLANVDLRIADLPAAALADLANLPAHATAANFGRLADRARPGDYALGILNLVFQTVGLLAAFAARQEGLADVVLTGRLATIPQARELFAAFAGLYPVRFHFPENPEYATAIGAALSLLFDSFSQVHYRWNKDGSRPAPMAKLLHEIEWSEPLLTPRPNASPEADLTERLSPWLRKAVGSLADPDQVSHAPLHLMGISYFVASQENACRYCYGMARAIMKIAGYREKQIQDLENEASLADGLTRQVVEFARKLARSNPSPARRDQEALVAAGLSEEAAREIAANVVKACFANRVSTFLALPPDEALERLPDSLLGRIRGLFLGRKFRARRVPPPAGFRNEGPCARTIAAAGRNPIAAWLRELTDGWFNSPLLPRRCRLLILAVIARQLGSRLCEEEASDGLVREGLPAQDTQALLATLSPASMTDLESTLVRWTRETVWYEPRAIQDSTRRLLAEVGEQRALEALGSAALCNTLARLALVLQ